MDLELKLGCTPMRIVLIACFAFVMCICVCVSIITSKESIVIDEVELNPYGDDLHSDVYEWVELYNPIDEDINLGSLPMKCC